MRRLCSGDGGSSRHHRRVLRRLSGGCGGVLLFAVLCLWRRR